MSLAAPLFMPLPQPSTPTTVTFDFGGGRSRVPRNKDFLNKYGHRHHSFDPEKAPYPLSYDRDVLELESMDHNFVMYVEKSVSVVRFTNGPPRRSLDLGCGGGTWVLEAAKEWPECEFVGFDLVDVQVPFSLLDPDIAKRIRWLHGNFLTTKLPFDDDEFDHVHMHSLGRGIPENKWGVLFEEVNRVLRPGGVVEVLENDILFPTLPSWFTAPLRVRNKRSDSIHHPHGPQHQANTPPQSPNPQLPPHDHALLESLYYGVFGNRFINLRPTAILPIYFTSNFRHVMSAPIVHFRMPALPPLQALPRSLSSSNPQLTGDSNRSDDDSQPTATPEVPPTPRAIALSFSSIDSTGTTNSASTGMSSLFDCSDAISDTNTHLTNSSPKRPLYIVDSSAAESTTGTGFSTSLIPLEEIDKLSETSLAMQLYLSYQSVLACQESMWEELVDRMRNRPEELRGFGWESDQELLGELDERAKFELLIDRYKRDMQARISLWCSLSEFGWAVPTREPLTKAELVEEERLHGAMLEARRFASDEDLQTPCRSVRIFVGYKDC